MLLWSVSKSLGTTCLGKMAIEELCALGQSSSNGVEHKSSVVMPRACCLVCLLMLLLASH